ncbi:MAG TPA: hypothetical protein VM888_11410 [Chitinophagaceae bacterium]|jgi:hypothetical protein|nr:hypothetical protein [Chitinophagaceae bacterium]
MAIHQSFKKVASSSTLFLSAIAFAAISSAATILYAAANFSGEWKLNEQKSELGQFGGRMAARKMVITGQAENLSIQRSSTSQDGQEVNTSEKLTFDGKPSESTVFGNSKKSSSSKWSDDGQTLNVASTIILDRNGETIEIKVTEVWKLIDGGNALSIESTSNSTFGTNTMKLVYDKVNSK